ncbi:MAG: ACT domain-containing protein [Candidatus Omnitrophica bacterium]|nr:ACT domain-containing protein [Candidatus Omnitrophota bacterium]
MAQRWIVTALGKDRPGIVAGVAKILYRLGCNLEDSAMTRLESEFAVMLIFSTKAKTSEAALRKAFAPLQRNLQLAVHLKPLTAQETRTPKKRSNTQLISVYGADKPGIVFRISDALARAGVNITDVHTHRSAGDGPSLYLLLLEVELPPRVSSAALEGRLKVLGKSLGVQTSLRSSSPDVL